MNFIKSPNLPNNKIKYAICDSRIGEAISTELNSLEISVISVPQNKILHEPVSAHPDMQILHLGGGNFLSDISILDLLNIKEISICEKFNNRRVAYELGREYPNDVLFNAVIMGKYIICNKKTVCNEIFLLEKEIINVNQGYTKCSVAVVNDDAIITDDISIYKSVSGKIDALYVEHGLVELNGYNYGFIGGACGKISKNILAFYGSIQKCKQYNDIKLFCSNHNVECISLSNKPLYDFGSLIPIIEE